MITFTGLVWIIYATIFLMCLLGIAIVTQNMQYILLPVIALCAIIAMTLLEYIEETP
jgi:bacteriorhodopsin